MKTKNSVAEIAAPSLSRTHAIVYGVAALIALLGVAETTYLTALHLSGANVVCVASSGCSEVLHSSWASIRGVPLAAIGGLAYFSAFSAALLAAFGSRRAGKFLALIVGAMFLATLGLLFVQARILHTFCDYCLLSAALVFLLAGLVIALPRHRA